MNFNNVAAVVLAAGQGKRIPHKQDQNKVALKLGDKPIISHTIETLKQLDLGQIVVVVGYAADSVKKAIGSGIDYVLQADQLGTGHALECALPFLKPQIKQVLVLYGDDSAFFPAYILKRAIELGMKQGFAFSFLTMKKNDPTGLGRVIRNKKGEVIKIVEERNANEKQRHIKEINVGGFCFKQKFLKDNIGKILVDPIKHERYLTDLVQIATESGKKVKTLCLESEDYWQGINTVTDLHEAERKMAGISKTK